MEAPKEIFIENLFERIPSIYTVQELNEVFPCTKEIIKSQTLRYHHDSKYQKAIEALKKADKECTLMKDHKSGPGIISSQINNTLRGLGEIE